jgi:hypothetical protein
MALDNIRERLMLFYDLEATLDTEQGRRLPRAHPPALPDAMSEPAEHDFAPCRC